MEGLEKLAPEIMPRTAYALPMRATSIAPAPAPAIPWEQKLHTLWSLGQGSNQEGSFLNCPYLSSHTKQPRILNTEHIAWEADQIPVFWGLGRKTENHHTHLGYCDWPP